MDERKNGRTPEPPQPPRAEDESEQPLEHPELTTGGTGTLPREGVPNPGFTARGD